MSKIAIFDWAHVNAFPLLSKKSWPGATCESRKINDLPTNNFFTRHQPDPIDAILHRLEALGLGRKDLEPMIGTRARVSEVLSRKRPLTINMIRRLNKEMRIPAEVLIRPYDVEGRAGA